MFIDLDPKRTLRLDSIMSVELIADKEEMQDYYNDDKEINNEIILIIDATKGTYILDEYHEIENFLREFSKWYSTQLLNTYFEWAEKLEIDIF